MSAAFYSFINSLTDSITSRYDVKHKISTAGLWNIYDGLHKTTQKKVAIFIFEKKSLDSTFRRERGASKNDTDKVSELLKKEASNLARLRHPSILQVVEPMTESRSTIAFVTEPLTGNLAHLVKKAQSYSSHGEQSGYDLDELEIQKGLLQVGKGLEFLNDAKVVHHNLNPEAIFVNAKGDWKIGGLGFGVFLNQGNIEAESFFEYNEYLPDQVQISLDYAAPEFVLNNEVSQANDMFSLGCLTYTIHNNGVPIMQTFNNLRTYENKIQALSSIDYRNVPPHLKDVIRRLLARHPSQRITLSEFQKSKYFDNILVSTMKFLESFPEKTREEKSQFMKGLQRVLPQFSDRVTKRKILPSLVDELKDHQLLPYTLPNIFFIGKQLSQAEFCDLILPALKPVFNIRDPPQNMIVLLDKLDALQEKTPRELFRDDVMPLVYAALENPAVIVQEKALRVVPSLCESLDYSTIKNSLFPRVQSLFLQTTVLSVKVSTLICFHFMIQVIDKYTMQEKLIPLLKNIKTKEPAVMLATLAVYDEMGKHLDKEIVATEILPQLWRMSFGPLLNVDQFKKFMRTINALTSSVEDAHIRHLQEVKSLEDQTRHASKSSAPTSMDGNGLDDQGDISFEALVSGSVTTISEDSDVFAPFSSNTGTTATTTNGIGLNDIQSSNNGGNRSSALLPSTPSHLLPSSSPTVQPKRPLSSGWALPSSASSITSATSSPTRPTFPTMTTTTTTSMTSSPYQQTSKPLMPLSPSSPGLFTSAPALPPPPTTPSGASSIANLSSKQSGSNYSALRGLSAPQQSPPIAANSRPLSTAGLLTPTSSKNSASQQNASYSAHQGHKSMNLTSFDPLG